MTVATESLDAPTPKAATPARVLVVEDDSDIRNALNEALDGMGYRVTAESTAENALRILEQSDFDMVLTDVRMPGMSGIDLCRYITGDRPGIPVVVMTAYGDVSAAVEALRAGAIDFITKPFEVARLAQVVGRALTQRRHQSGMLRLKLPSLPDDCSFSELVGSSDAMQSLRREIAQLALSDSSVLITGESGTGKELVARALHGAGQRKNGKFMAVDCCAVPHDILEAELFGYVRGAFTGADRHRQGLFIEASNGTLFLDEIGDMPLSLQPKLLRALQDRSVRKIGSSREEPFDARIIAATNRDLSRAVSNGEFRIDLLHRLNVLNISIPPLRKRGHDVIELAAHFVAQLTGDLDEKFEITHAAELALMEYDWPGNVRELQNCISSAAAMASNHRIGVDELPEEIRNFRPQSSKAANHSIEEVERQHIEAVLNALGWNKVMAARTLGIDRATLYRKLLRLGLQGPSTTGG